VVANLFEYADSYVLIVLFLFSVNWASNKNLLQFRNMYKQIGTLFITKIIPEMLGGLWAVEQRRLVATTDVSGQHICHIFNIQPLKEKPGMF